MVTLNLRSLTQPVGALRILEVVLTCISFSLAASAGHNSSSYWAWSMFTWCFCCFFTLFILIMELTSLSAKVPISWDDFTTAFAMLATLMCLAASVIYPAFFTCPTCSRQIVATVVSLLCFGAYVGEVALTRFRPGEVSGFLSTVPGLLKILETFVACIIFTSLDPAQYHSPGLQWCVAAYSICFIFALLIVLLTIGQLLSVFPFGFEKLVIVYNGLAAFMYMTATVIWPLYSFENNPRPNPCLGRPCLWDNLVVVSFMTAINTAVYIMDTVYSVNVVFFTPIE